eukprot:TRINITY_DN32661_c0_g1_i3.p1 TRINITY_DN32661_c0_g1~~TRINITY_DN32661_c0_g1_i3.p1  ORF type:complete len:435 (-),score=55.47 TRINITY_DN32661_c0_g1_i3:246-1550(-)
MAAASAVQRSDASLPALTRQEIADRLQGRDSGDEAAMQRFVSRIARLTLVHRNTAVDPLPTLIAQCVLYMESLEKSYRLKQEKQQETAQEVAQVRFIERMANTLRGRRLALDEQLYEELLNDVIACSSLGEMLHKHLEDALYDTGDDSVYDGSESGTPLGSVAAGSLQQGSFHPVTAVNWKDSPDRGPNSGSSGLPLFEVAWSPPEQDLKSAPSQHLSIILANLPRQVTGANIHEALEPCGMVSHVDIHEEWVGSEELRMSKLTKLQQMAAARRYRPSYAVVEFETAEGYSRATRTSAQLFGILLREEVPTKTKKGFKVVGRPAFPQEAHMKRTLMLTDFPWKSDVGPQEILNAIRERLPGCDLDSQFFAARQDSVLRGITLSFPTFELAYVAKKRLAGLELSGLPVKCGFIPLRPQMSVAPTVGSFKGVEALV